VATTFVLVAATALWFGADVWIEYVQKVVPQQHWLLIAAGDHAWNIVSSVFGHVRGSSGLVADDWCMGRSRQSGGQGAALIGAVVWTFPAPARSGAVAGAVRHRDFPVLAWMLNYDMVVFGWVVALLRGRDDETYVDHGSALAVWTLPG